MNTGLRNPGRNSLISAAMILAGAASVLWGISEMQAHDGAESNASASAIGVGGLVTILGFVALVNFLRGVVAFRALQSGRDEIARWRVTADEFERFRKNDDERSALGWQYINDYRLPKKTDARGLEVIFGRDAVMIGDTYHGLSSTGLFRFAGVQILPQVPLVLEFGTMATTAWQGATIVRVANTPGLLRVPIGAAAREDANRVLQYFQAVDRGEIRVHSRRYARALKGGLLVAVLCAGSAIYGWSIRASGSDLALVTLVVGVVGGLGALLFSCVAGMMQIAERKGR